MARRASSLQRASVGVDRDIDSRYDIVKVVALNIDHILDVAGGLDYTVRYQGVMAAHPTERFNGEALEVGDFYINSTTTFPNYYTGTEWVEATDAEYRELTEEVLEARDQALAAATAAAGSEQTVIDASNIATTAATASQTSAVASEASRQASATMRDSIDLLIADAEAANEDANAILASTTTLVSDAEIYATNAAASESSADQSRTAAASSESAAAVSAAEAANSEAATALLEASASTSAFNAAASETVAVGVSANARSSEINAKTSETNAKESEDNAKVSEDNAAASEASAAVYASSASDNATLAANAKEDLADAVTLAGGYKDNAAASATAAATSATNANTSETSATTSATLAGASEAQAAISAGAASTSEINAAASEAAAGASEASALTSETNAAASETAAKVSEVNAASSETAAVNSAVVSSNAADAASLSEANAASSEANASTSATSASNSATSAASDATTAAAADTRAQSSATSAAISESNAATSESNAATSESNALSYSTAAGVSETNAKASETNAAASESSAAVHAANAAAAFDNFDDRYLGAKSTGPALDNDGQPLAVGASYWDSTEDILKFWNGAEWESPESTASQAAQAAYDSELAAAASELAAATSAEGAETTKAQVAGYVATAADHESASSVHAATATSKAVEASTSAADAAASELAASSSASDAAVSADAASGALADTNLSKDLAQQYANHPEDVIIPGTSEYSAYHWKQKAQTIAGGTAPDSEKLDGFDSSYFARADQVLTDVPANAVFTDTTYTIVDGELSENNFTSSYKDKLTGIETGANYYEHPIAHSIVEITGLGTALDGKVDTSQVLTDVPAEAVFTDTTYAIGDGGLTEVNFTAGDRDKLAGISANANDYNHPDTHPPSIILQDDDNRFVAASQILEWDTAFGWGFHGDQGYAKASDPVTWTAAQTIQAGDEQVATSFVSDSGRSLDIYVPSGDDAPFEFRTANAMSFVVDGDPVLSLGSSGDVLVKGQNVVLADDSRLTDSRTPKAHNHDSDYLQTSSESTLDSMIKGSDNLPLIQVNGGEAYFGATSRDGLQLATSSNPIWRTSTDSYKLFNDSYHPTADKWTAARKITLGGALSGSATIDGSSDITLTAAVEAGSHTHPASEVTTTATTRFVTDTQINTWDSKAPAHSHPYRSDSWTPSWGEVSGKPSTFSPSLTGNLLTAVPANAEFTDTVYSHPASDVPDVNTSGATIIDSIATNGTGHITSMGTRTLTLEDLKSGVAQKVFDTSNTSTAVGKFTKVATVTLPVRYNDANAVLRVISRAEGSSEVNFSEVTLGFKQQAAFGSDPVIQVNQYYKDDITYQFGYVIVRNLPNTIIDVYVQITASYTTLTAWSEVEAGSAPLDWLSHQPLVDTPVDIVMAERYPDYNADNFVAGVDYSAPHSHPYRADDWVPTWSQVTEKPTSFNPSLTGHLLTSVPSGAKFTDTTYAVGDGGLTENNFTSGLKTKLEGIAVGANAYSHPATHPISTISGLQTALDGKVDDSQVLTNVPSGAKFTDTVYTLPSSVVHSSEPQALNADALRISGHTISLFKGDGSYESVTVPDNDTTYSVGDGGLTQKNFTTTLKAKLDGVESEANAYTHPSSHPASMITEDSTHRFVTDTEKEAWNTPSGVTQAQLDEVELLALAGL